MLFFSVREVRVYEIRNAAIGARSDCPRDQRIGGRLVAMLIQRHDVHQARLLLFLVGHQLDEPNQVAVQKCPDERAVLGKRRAHLPHRLDVFAVVREGLALPCRDFVVDGPDAVHQGVVEGHFPNGHAILFGSADHVPRLVVDLLCPPVIEGRHLERSQVVPFHRVPMLRRGIRQSLQECEDINTLSRKPYGFEDRLRIVHELIFVPLDTTDAD